MTVVDALDTMHIMGLDDQFDRGVRLVEKTKFAVREVSVTPFFPIIYC